MPPAMAWRSAAGWRHVVWAIMIAAGWDAVTDSMMGFSSVESNCDGLGC